jgi:cardiolipin synthase
VNGPNLLSLARILLTIPAVWAIVHARHGLATVVLAAALATDFLDGWLARRHGGSTELGKILDPAADKVLAAGVLAALVHAGRVPLELAGVVILRDVFVLAFAWLRLRAGAGVPSAGLLGKVAFAALGVFLAGEVAGPGWPSWAPGAVGALYVVAGLTYTKRIPGVPLGRILKGER